eukprot:CAMPEP_0194068692 /NCGR_PEP_ID=MMETSP0009_2-20130614/87233_1 /TAXON_ID=210454 /ORGANISM="Grammatophora oceanica, Strain CCMP 410" /LENGTH=566 /DNA_ID=CAMNT_0038721815 /DNA_START=84 /DNA_END=1784 /DNA_ORIENTATION=+
MKKTADGKLSRRDQIISLAAGPPRAKMLLSKNDLSLEPSFIVNMRGRNLKREIRAVARWRETKEVDDDGGVLKPSLSQMEPENVFPLILNLISCFLFMMNSYIIEPSSAYYVESLGADDALAGIVIGLTPWAAIASSVCYSFWTNYSYKSPILFAVVLSMLGNILYGNAYGSKSVTMCLVGRVLSGLGAPRIINRRYLADATPMALRTMANAAFGVATAVGAAMGPGMAIILDTFDFNFYFPFCGIQTFNGMTGPGYFMALLWLLYAAVVIVFFNEPKRTGLEELKKREEEERAIESNLRTTEEDDQITESLTCLSNDEMSIGFDSVVSKPIDPRPSSVSPCMQFGCLQHITLPVVLCMTLIMMKRIALESVVAATSILSKNRYGWSVKNVGTLHFVNGLLVIPISMLAGYLSRFFEDRYLALCLLGVALFGIVSLIDVTDFYSHDNKHYNDNMWLSVGPIRYIGGSMIAFGAIEACESFVASLMSKVVPVALASGTFNAGLLATLVGTFGRAFGDVFISAMGYISIRNLLNLLMVPNAGLLATLVGTVRTSTKGMNELRGFCYCL